MKGSGEYAGAYESTHPQIKLVGNKRGHINRIEIRYYLLSLLSLFLIFFLLTLLHDQNEQHFM